jgi:hypothetical protein
MNGGIRERVEGTVSIGRRSAASRIRLLPERHTMVESGVLALGYPAVHENYFVTLCERLFFVLGFAGGDAIRVSVSVGFWASA